MDISRQYFLLLVQLVVLLYLCAGGMNQDGNSFCHAAKILVPGPAVHGNGHTQVLSTLTNKLVQLGHNVTLLSGSQSCTKKFTASNASQIIYYRSPYASVSANFTQEISDVKFHAYDHKDHMKLAFALYDSIAADCRTILSDNVLFDKLRSERFDLLIGDVATPCDIFIANILHIPWIAVTASREFIGLTKSIYRVPTEVSYVPVIGMHTLTDKMTFMERVANTMFRPFFDYYISPFLLRDFIRIKEEYNIASHMDFWEMSSKAEIWLSQTSLVLDFPAPGLPNVIDVGGLGVRPSNALSQVS